jgi:4-aminobutyrate aminotransferase-like enzyme
VEHTASVGKYLNDHLHNLMDRYQFIGDVRGIGLMQAMEFVKDRVTKENFDESLGLGDKLTEKFRNQGLLLEASNTILSFTPPLCITNAEVDEIIRVVSSSLEEASKELSLQ